MKKFKELPAELAERLELPGEIVPGAGLVCLKGGRQALIQGQRGLLEYSGERIVVALSRGKLRLSGSGLELQAMNGDELMVTGRIQAVEWE